MPRTRYSFRYPNGPTEIERGVDSEAFVNVQHNGSAATITAATYSLYDDGGTAIVDAQAATVSGGDVTYTIPAASTTGKDPSDRWREVWSLTIDSETYTGRNTAALVLYPFQPVIGQSDLEDLSRDFANADLKPTGLTSYQGYIDEATRQIRTRLLQQDRRPWLIVNPWSLRTAHLYLTAAIICRDFRTLMRGSKWDALYDDYKELYDSEWGRLVFEYDSDNDGESDGPESAVGVLWISGNNPNLGWDA